MKKIIICFAMLSFLQSCAYFFNSKTVELSISSNPSGADIVIEGKNYGQTPAKFLIEPKSYNVTLTKEGYGSTQFKTEWWQDRSNISDRARCSNPVDILFFSYWTVYCRDFKKKEYFVTIPYTGTQQQMRYAPPQYAPSQYQMQY